MTANAAIKKRLEIETALIAKYEGKYIEAYYMGKYSHGTIKTIGVDWMGDDEFEVILNLDNKRIVLPYGDFLNETEIL